MICDFLHYKKRKSQGAHGKSSGGGDDFHIGLVGDVPTFRAFPEVVSTPSTALIPEKGLNNFQGRHLPVYVCILTPLGASCFFQRNRSFVN